MSIPFSFLKHIENAMDAYKKERYSMGLVAKLHYILELYEYYGITKELLEAEMKALQANDNEHPTGGIAP